MKTASFWRRALALLVDAATGLGAIGLAFATGLLDDRMLFPEPGWFWTEWWLKFWLDDPDVFYRPVVWWLALTLAWTLAWELASGRTPGDRLLGVEVVDADGDLPHPGRIALRGLGMTLNVATLGLGWLWALVAPSRRALHDVISGTYVVRRD